MSYRVPSNSKRGRQLAHAKGAVVASDLYPSQLTEAQREWNSQAKQRKHNGLPEPERKSKPKKLKLS